MSLHGHKDVCVCVRLKAKKQKGYVTKVCETEREKDRQRDRIVYIYSRCSTAFHLQSSLFHFSVFNMLPQRQMANHFNYSEAIDLLNKLTYSNLLQSHNSSLLYNVRNRSSVLWVQAITFGTDEKTFCGRT